MMHRFILALILLGCASKPEAPPCDPATAAKLAAESALAGENCAAAGVAEADCKELHEVDQRFDARQSFCAKRINEE